MPVVERCRSLEGTIRYRQRRNHKGEPPGCTTVNADNRFRFSQRVNQDGAMTATPDTKDLVEAVAPTVRAVLALTDAAQTAAGIGLPSADSAAMAEVAAEPPLVNAHLREPIHAAHSLSAILAFAAGDHLRNYARLFASQPVPVYSHLVVARACLDACSVAFWLNEPGIGAERRVQRYLVLRLDNAKQQKRSPLVVSKDKAKEIIEEVRLGVAEAGWALQAHLNDGNSPRVAAEALPSPKSRIGAVLGDMTAEAERAGLGPALWWYLSGVTHGASYGLMQAVEAQAEQHPSMPQMGAIFTDARSVILMAWALATAFVSMTDVRMAVFGWQSSAWSSAKERQRDNFLRFPGRV